MRSDIEHTKVPDTSLIRMSTLTLSLSLSLAAQMR